MKKICLKTKVLLAGAFLTLAGASTQAQVPVVDSTQPPMPGFYDQYYLPGAVVEGADTIGSPNTNDAYAGIVNGYSGNNDQYTYVSTPDRTSKAESFTTGSSPLGYTLKSFTFQQADGGPGGTWLNNGTFFTINNGDGLLVRIGSLPGPYATTYTTLLETNATYTGTTYNTGGTTSALGIYFHFDLSGANLTLSPNTTYFVEIMTATNNANGNNSDHFELNNTDTNPVSTTFPPIYLQGQALSGNSGANLDQTGSFGVVPNGGVFAFDAGLSAVGAPIIAATAKPSGTASGQPVKITATITPGNGTVTNVSVDLSPIGGSAAFNLVLSNANVYTNTFIVSATAPLGITNLTVIAEQDATPIEGGAYLPFTVLAGSPPEIVQDTSPTNIAYLYVGQGVTFSANFSGVQPIIYNWQHAGDSDVTFTNITDATNTTFTIPSADMSSEGYYQLQASNQYGATISTYTYVQMQSGTPTYLWSAPIPFAGLTAEEILTNFPADDKIAGAMVAKNGGNPITVVLTNANNQPVVFAAAGNWATLSGGAGYGGGGNTNQTGNASFNTCLSDYYFDNATHNITLSGLQVGQQYQVQLFALDNRVGNGTRLVNYQDPANDYDIAENMAMNDNVYVLGTFTASSNVMTIQQNLPNSVGNFNALVLRSMGWTPPPYFTLDPVNKSGFLGASVALSGSAAGDTTIPSPTITYQWESGPAGGPYAPLTEGDKYAGTTTPTLTISNLAVSDGVPAYVLVAADGGGSTTSSVANVFVQAPPVPPTPGSYGDYVVSTNFNNLVAFWQLNETNDPSTGLLTAYDFSGSGHSGTYGTTSQNGFNGVMGPTNYLGFAANQGALATGVQNVSDANSVVTVPPLNMSTNSVDTTICMWIKPNNTVPTACGLLFDRTSTAATRAGFGFGGSQSGGLTDLGYNWNDTQATWSWNSPLYVPLNTWSFVALVVQSNQATAYLDYVDAGGQTHLLSAVHSASHAPVSWNGGTIWLGGDSYGGGASRVFPGDISDAAIYNSALTSDQILKLFGAGLQVQGFAPEVNAQPQSFSIYTNMPAQFSTQVGGTGPLAYQWQFISGGVTNDVVNSANITGANSNVLTILSMTPDDVGSYQLVITNSFGSTNSAVATLSIFSQPHDLLGEWLDGGDTLADSSGFTPAGTHDGYFVGASNVTVYVTNADTSITTNMYFAALPGTNYWFTNDVPPGATGVAIYLKGIAISISNSSTMDAAYTNTYDDTITNSFTVMFWAKGAPGAWSWNPWVSKYGDGNPAVGWQFRTGGANSANGSAVPCWTVRDNGAGSYVLGSGPGWAKGGDLDDLHAAVSGAGSGATYFGVDNNTWHFYAGTYDALTHIRNLYVDGVLRGQEINNGPYVLSPASHLVLGGKDSGGNSFGNYFTGELYGVRIYSYTMSQTDIAKAGNLPPTLSNSVITGTGPNNGMSMVLAWPYGTLLEATNVAGPWNTTTNTSPFTNNMTLPADFFKVSNP